MTTNKEPPNLITPTARVPTQNYFNPLVTEEEAPTSTQVQDTPVPSIPDEAYLPTSFTPTGEAEDNSDTKSNSDFSMGSSSTDTTGRAFLDAAELLKRMQTVDSSCTGSPNKDFRYTDVVKFQTVMGKALRTIRQPYKQYGYCFLADTDEAYKEKTGQKPSCS